MASYQDDRLLIPTSYGTVLGTVNSSFPNVNQDLGIPYAQPPLGALRFLPPQPFPPSTSIINATTMPPACPQIKDTTYPVFQYVPETLPLGSFSEDCLTLNIYTPSNATASSNLPVIIWIYDGAFVQGSFDTPEWNLAPWVQTSQAHIVVAVQYRLNIFGFPGAAPALEHQNLDILDQRRAVEAVVSIENN
ncbi:hypothetical protein K456DRAFT_1911134 [Colletotrichum gloeosporioides 23]|nr:hypothetical protein K456DRAFT_1911134 [Colletotrichum gloeosporioides 23]